MHLPDWLVAAAEVALEAGSRHLGTAVFQRTISRHAEANGWVPELGRNDLVKLSLAPRAGGVTRTVSIFPTNGARAASFTAFSHSAIHVNRVPPGLWPGLLLRNSELPVGTWAYRSNDGIASFIVQACVPVAGLDAEFFAYICSSLLDETDKFDRGLDRGHSLQ